LPIATSYVSGIVSPEQSTATVTISQVSGLAGQLVSVPVIANEVGEVGAIDLIVNFDNTKLTLASYTHDQLTNWNVNQTANQLTLGWFDAAGATVADGTLLTLN
ncbi:cohesin domain-containing protein, partial [Arthrospira platensis SPKY1]|nr:cohesin domain-containing protein [Arthrospira platensis SPKY1]